MFVRVKNVGPYQYLQIAQNRREGKRVKQSVIATLGRLDKLTASGAIDQLLRSAARFAERVMVLSQHSRDAHDRPDANVVSIGPALIFERLWRETGCQEVVRKLLATRHHHFDVERAVFMTVLHRLMVSGSDRSALQWRRDQAIDGAEALELQHLYRAMGWLGEALGEREPDAPSPRRVKDLIEEELFARRRDLFTSLDLVFFDTTSLFFTGNGGDTLGQYGKSKDHRSDCKQMVLGMVIDGDGIPVCSEMWPGNTTDVTTLDQVAQRLQGRFGVRRVCLVADAGMISKKMIAAVEARGWFYILGARLRRTKEVRDVVLSDTGAFDTVEVARQRPDPMELQVKEVTVHDTPSKGTVKEPHKPRRYPGMGGGFRPGRNRDADIDAAGRAARSRPRVDAARHRLRQRPRTAVLPRSASGRRCRRAGAARCAGQGVSVLEALARQYERLHANGEAPPYGYSRERITCALVLSHAGEPVAVSPLSEACAQSPARRLCEVPHPVRRTSRPSANFLWDKTAYVFGVKRHPVTRRPCPANGEHDAFRDPPEHTRLRKVAARAFTKPKLTALAPTIEALADEIVERAAARGHVEWIGEVAQPLAMRVMLRLLGIAENEEARWQRWSADRARLLEMIATRSERKTAHITGESITGYFLELLAERARSEGDDAISTLAREAARAELINTTEAADMLGVIMIAGNETTANLIGNGLWALMRHPDEMERLREEPGRARDAISEVLRYDSPVQTDFRIAKSEAVIGGKTIRAGEGVILLTGSANRDEAAFSEPDRLDIARKGPKHAAFGHGVHQCIGAELARMETSAVIASAAARFERITLAGREPQYRRSTVVRGLEHLEVRIERRHRTA